MKLVFAMPVPAHVARRPRELAGGPSRRSSSASRCQRHYVEAPDEQERIRVVAFAFLTPFFFLKGGMNVSLGALWANLGILGCSSPGRWCRSSRCVYPLARRYCSPHAAFTTLLMSTGLTFGTISALYGLNAGIIDRTQFSLLVAVVVLSAIVPTVIAQRFFQPGTEHEPELSRAQAEQTFG